MVYNQAYLRAVDDLPQRSRNWARRVLTEACRCLYQVPSEFTAGRFGVSTSLEALHVDEMQAVIVELEGTDN